ncbi:unnamed protein product, partial [Pleuronectes platessa]
APLRVNIFKSASFPLPVIFRGAHAGGTGEPGSEALIVRKKTVDCRLSQVDWEYLKNCRPQEGTVITPILPFIYRQGAITCLILLGCLLEKRMSSLRSEEEGQKVK